MSRAVVGLAYTGVLLSDGSCGLAATLTEGWGCRAHPAAGELAGRSAWELARGLISPHPVASSLALATVNAVLGDGAAPSPDPVEALEVGAEDVVGLVGYIGPLVDRLRGKVKELLVFERAPGQARGLFPDWAVETELPRCTAVYLTGTTFANKTVDRLLALSRGRVAVIGPSTPLWPGLLGLGVDWLFGVRVPDPERALRVIAEGGGTRALFAHGVVKVALGRGHVDH